MANLGVWEIEPQGRGSGGSDLRSLEEVLAGLDIVEVDVENGFILTNKKLTHPIVDEYPDMAPMGERGAAGTRWRRVLGGQEYNMDVLGARGLQTYDRMRRSDGAVAAALKIAKTPVLEAQWWVDPADPNDAQAVMIADFVERALFEWQTIGWTQFLTESLTMLDFGYSFFEKVFRFATWKQRQRVIWQKFAPRAVEDVSEWEYDAHGGPRLVRMIDFDGRDDVRLPITKLIVFSYRMESGNLEGRSAMREMYKHWYYKENLYKIDAIQKERHGIGIPVITLPPNFSEEDRRLANELGRNLRTNEWAHIVLPPLWSVEFAEVKGQTVNVLDSIVHHDMKIMESVLGGFTGQEEKGDAQIQLDIFMKASRFFADIVREVINKYAIPELVSYNWRTDLFPKLRVRHIGQIGDLRTISFTVRNLVGAGVIIPDEKLEEYMRDINDLPRMDKTTQREIATPQRPGAGRTGLPRQSTANRQRIQPGANAGEDDSGG